MFKSGRWRNEKNKFKAVFKLQFHATQLEQVGGDALMISLVPADVGKPTVRSEKAAIRDGSCYWENPVYEAVKLFQEPKSGKIHEKTYYFVISTGSSKAGLVGEVSIDFASYAESNKPSSVSLPLKNTKCGAILHVSIQRLPENIDQRYPEQSENVKNNLADGSLKTQLRNNNPDMKIDSNSTQVSIQRLLEKSDQRYPDQSKHAKIISPDGSLKTQLRNGDADMNIDSNFTEVSIQCLPENIGERDAKQSENAKINSADRSLKTQLRNCDADVNNNSSNSTEDGPSTNKIPHVAGLNGNRRASSGSDLTMTSSESSSGLNTPIQFLCPGEVISEDKSQQALESMIEKLRTELTGLSRVAEVSELELQSLRKQIAKERKRGQDLSREVVILKEERDAFKEKCEKHMDEARVENKLKLQGGNSFALVEELREELNYEKDLNANLRLQLQKMQESNTELILALRDLDIMVEQKDKELCNLSNLFERFQENMSQLKMGDDEERKTLEELAMESGSTKEPHLPDEKSMEVYGELQRCKDDLEMQMEQLSLDYEILKQENNELSYKLEQSRVQEQLKMQYECSSPYDIVNELESHIENLESELEKRSNECLESLATVTKLERQIKDLVEEMEKQGQGFEADLEILIGAKVEQEQRAIRADAALKKMQWQNLSRAERLQDELRNVLMEVAFSLEENEKMTTKAETEASELRLQISYLEELVSKANEEIQSVSDRYEAKLNDMASEIDHGKKHGEETQRVLSQDIQMLKAEIGRLETENNTLYDEVQRMESLKDELEQMKTSMEEKQTMLRRGNMERTDMESMIHLLRKDAEVFTEELNLLRGFKNENELVIERLKTENNALYDEVQWIKSFKDELEQMKTSMEEKETMLRRGNMDRNDLKSTIDILRKDAETLTEELNLLRGLKEEKELVIGRLETEKSSLYDEVQRMESLKDELEQMKTSMEEKETMLRRGSMGRNDLESMIDSLRKDAEMLTEELNLLRGLKDEKELVIGRLETENNALYDEVQRIESLKDELEQMKTSMEEKETMLRRGSMERNDLESMINSLRKDAEMLTEEQNLLRGLKDENEFVIGNLQLELDALKSKYTDSNRCLFKDDFEEEELRNQACEVNGDLNNEGAFSNLEKQLIRDNETYCMVVKDPEGIALNGSVPKAVKNWSVMPMIRSCSEVSLVKEVEASIFSTLHEGHLEELLREMELLREKNTSMEGELKQMQERYSDISLKFAEVEGERQRLQMMVNRKNRKKS
ncbi:uncharacterized protein LOC131315615 isoform X1 [Rhododendron vialii]|uniref:uncharacterized protein LOC131315615 isoform X1 n=1 Tax=Rhododendron vialii TaxID=182163 RepID=UPI0026604506|nr:uncharacterized protein LOC131315615 isoform X1 [Rhododendron vialii]